MTFNFFKKKKEKSEDDRFITLTIRDVIPVAKDTVNLVFEESAVPFNYQPGQFLTLIDRINGEKVRRAYSLSSNPYEDRNPAVTVKRVKNGKMSNHINDNFHSGMQVEIMKPMGIFTTTINEAQERKLMFIGGGSGITPLYSMIRSIIVKESKTKLHLIFGNRSEEYIIFKKELEELAVKNEGKFSVTHILEDDANGIADIVGRPSVEIIKDIVQSKKDFTNAEFFICGPEPMMNVAIKALHELGVDKSNIQKESFEAGVTSPKELIEGGDTAAARVTIILEGEEYVIPVSMGSSILETALDAGLDMPYSCQSGLCTACRGFCHEGDITTEDAEGLSQSEMDQGYRLLCTGKPISQKIIVEVG